MFDQINPAHVGTLFFFANTLVVASYLVRDILWLRLLAIAATICAIPYFLVRPEPMVSAALWQLTFMTVNGFHAVLLIRERRPIPLTPEQAWLYENVFPLFTRRQMLRLLDCADWAFADEDRILIREGERFEHLLLVVEGTLNVESGDRVYARLQPGQFAGEMSFLSGQPTSASAVATTHTRYLSWDVSRLKALLERNDRLRGLFESVLSLDLVRKLDPKNQQLHAA